MNYRRVVLTVFACLLCSLNVFAQTSESLTEQQIVDVINSVDRAARRKSIAGVIAPLADDVKIKLSVMVPGTNEEKVMTLTKEEYAFHTRRAFQSRVRYTLQRKNLKVKIYEDLKTAVVTSDVYETLTVPQGSLRSVASEVAFVTLRNGKPVFTSLEGRLRFY